MGGENEALDGGVLRGAGSADGLRQRRGDQQGLRRHHGKQVRVFLHRHAGENEHGRDQPDERPEGAPLAAPRAAQRDDHADQQQHRPRRRDLRKAQDVLKHRRGLGAGRRVRAGGILRPFLRGVRHMPQHVNRPGKGDQQHHRDAEHVRPQPPWHPAAEQLIRHDRQGQVKENQLPFRQRAQPRRDVTDEIEKARCFCLRLVRRDPRPHRKQREEREVRVRHRFAVFIDDEPGAGPDESADDVRSAAEDAAAQVHHQHDRDGAEQRRGKPRGPDVDASHDVPRNGDGGRS